MIQNLGIISCRIFYTRALRVFSECVVAFCFRLFLEIDLFSLVILLFLPIMHFYTASNKLIILVIDESKYSSERTSMKNFYRPSEIFGEVE